MFNISKRNQLEQWLIKHILINDNLRLILKILDIRMHKNIDKMH